MRYQYSVIDPDFRVTRDLIARLDQLGNYEQVGIVNPFKPIDAIISGTPNLIFINIDKYTSAEFYDLAQIINDIYRGFDQKPFLVALALSSDKAFDCIRNSFFYYLLKPIDESELQRLDYKLQAKAAGLGGTNKKLCLQTYSDYRFIEIDEILYLKANNNNTEFFLINETKLITLKSLKHFESVLPHFFCRIHQSFIINQNYISRINLGKSECYLKPLKICLPFSKSYKNVVRNLAVDLASKSLI
ncbi:LytTR family transcriptional regulator DNA-binding domain-containing protein [bacterium]|nr:LytTR family transcriptional regulator DNA-binding domain-containing protein [bacterium]